MLLTPRLHKLRDEAIAEWRAGFLSDLDAFNTGFSEGVFAAMEVLLGTDSNGIQDRVLEMISEMRELKNELVVR